MCRANLTADHNTARMAAANEVSVGASSGAVAANRSWRSPPIQRWTDKHMNAISLTITTALVGLATGSAAFAQVSTTDRVAVEAYRTAIRSAQSGRTTQPIESAFSALGSMRVALLEVRNGHTVLESLSDEEFRDLGQLPCAIINRQEVLLVEPEVDCFVRLARARGAGR